MGFRLTCFRFARKAVWGREYGRTRFHEPVLANQSGKSKWSSPCMEAKTTNCYSPPAAKSGFPRRSRENRLLRLGTSRATSAFFWWPLTERNPDSSRKDGNTSSDIRGGSEPEQLWPLVTCLSSGVW